MNKKIYIMKKRKFFVSFIEMMMIKFQKLFKLKKNIMKDK